jgi:hypothetical protein
MSDVGEPWRAIIPGCGSVVLSEHAPDDILIDLDANVMCNLLRNPWVA